MIIEWPWLQLCPDHIVPLPRRLRDRKSGRSDTFGRRCTRKHRFVPTIWPWVSEDERTQVYTLKLALYTLHARQDESSSNLSALQEKRRCCSKFYDVNMSANSKTDSEFSRLSFGEILQNSANYSSSNYFTLTGARFSGKSLGLVFPQRWKTKVCKNLKTAFTHPTFFELKFHIPPDSMYCEHFGRFHRRKFKKITI